MWTMIVVVMSLHTTHTKNLFVTTQVPTEAICQANKEHVIDLSIAKGFNAVGTCIKTEDL